MKILWLCSWYPHSTDNLDGDFVERHAKSLATQQKVDVIHLVQNINLLKGEDARIEMREDPNIKARIYYVPYPQSGIKKLDQVLFNRRFYAQLKLALNTYINENSIPDIVHVHVPVKMGIGAVWLKRKYKIPFVVTEHATTYFKYSHDNYFNRGFIFRYATQKVFSEAKAVLSVSYCLMKVLEDMFSIRKAFLIRNAVNTSLFFPVEVKNKVKRFIHVSMMVPFKNIEGILKVLARLNTMNRSWEMTFVGPASDYYIQLAIDLGLDKQVSWKGTLSYEDVAKEVQQSDALIHFSKYENLPCVVNEALCCGLPVITSDVGGIAELINDSNGILVENENIDQLTNAMLTYLLNPDRFNKQMISTSASAMFNYDFIGKEIIQIYKEVLKGD